MNKLSANARAGSLAEAETQELDSYLHIGFLFGMMQVQSQTPAENRELKSSFQINHIIAEQP